MIVDKENLQVPFQAIYDALKEGEENAVASKKLCAVFHLSERELRQNIEALRRSGLVILSSTKGYYLAGTIDELRRFVKRERSRALSVLRNLKPAVDKLKEDELSNEFGGYSIGE